MEGAHCAVFAPGSKIGSYVSAED